MDPTMVKFGKARRALLAKQFSDGANLAVGGFIFGQFVSGRTFSMVRLAWGLGLWLLLVGVSLTLQEEKTYDS